MPRTADPDVHARRRAQLVDAVFRIVRRDGIDQVSVRAVAREAGLSMGSLRYYFATQGELLSFALAEVERRLRARLEGLDPTGPPREAVLRVLHRLVPMSPESLVEHEVWLAFTSHVLADPKLRAQQDRADDDLRELFGRLVAALDPERPAAERDLAAERLYALVDGLALHAVLRPARWPPERLDAVLRAHLDTLPGGADAG